MGIVLLATFLGLVVGSAIWQGDMGWQLGALMGCLGGLLVSQFNKVKALSATVLLLNVQVKELGKKLAQLETQVNASNTLHSSSSINTNIINAEQASTVKSNQGIPHDVLESAPIKVDAPNDVPAIKPAVVKPQSTKQPTVQPRSVEPNPIEKLIAFGIAFFTKGNPIVRVGMVVMFFGISFLVKYASSQGLLPIEYRLTGVILAAIALVGIGWKMRGREGGYGLVLQGGGVAMLYLTLFATAKIYALLPLNIAFGLLFIVVMFGAALALLQNAQVLAILATAGGFLTPILTSTGGGSHVGLFSFYLILNLGILAIALYKAWRLLNWVGFIFTFVITVAWGILQYEPHLYLSTQPFLIAFFALYLAVAVLFSFKQPTNLKGVVDGSLVFGLPLVAFGLQACLLKHTTHGLSISALGLSAVYLSLAIWLARRYVESHRVLVESFLALGIGFATLAIPLALDAQWTSTSWALEAAGLIWIGLRQQRLRPRVAGYLLHIAAAIALLIHGIKTGATPIVSGDFINLTILSMSAFIASYLLVQFSESAYKVEKTIAPIALCFGWIWWFVAGISEISAHTYPLDHFSGMLIFACLSAVAAFWVGQKLEWMSIKNSVFALLPFSVLLSAIAYSASNISHPLQHFGWLALGLFFVVQYRFLFLQESTAKMGLLSAWHIISAWLLFALIFWEIEWHRNFYEIEGSLKLIVWLSVFVVPVAILLLRGSKVHWPFDSFENDYRNWVPAPLFLLSLCWFFVASRHAQIEYEFYLPILNLLDLGHIAVLLLFVFALRNDYLNYTFLAEKKWQLTLLGSLFFACVNLICLRAMHQYQHVEYNAESLWHSVDVQMALSILWTLCALFIMNMSRRLQQRPLWMLGAALLGVVVLKLATQDLTNSGTLARIISFMVVGGLMLLIGYLSPIPPKINEQHN